jgi:ubiquinone/menaquinone biosynthesis C-methylase UbiE
MEELIRSILGDDRPDCVLDIACGRGRSLELITSTLPGYRLCMGIDTNTSVLRVAQSIFFMKDVELAQMFGEHLAIQTGVCDLVCILASLHHMNMPELVIDEMLRVLRPGGRFLLAEMYNDALVAPRSTAVQIHHWAADVDALRGVFHRHTFARQSITRLVDQLPLEQVVYNDFVEVSSDPYEAEALPGVGKYIDQYMAFIELNTTAQNSAEAEILVQQGQDLKIQLEETGFLQEPVVVVVGRKPLEPK